MTNNMLPKTEENAVVMESTKIGKDTTVDISEASCGDREDAPGLKEVIPFAGIPEHEE